MKKTTLLLSTLLGAFALWPGTSVAQSTGATPQEPQRPVEIQATEFIYVEGSLTLVPSSNTIATKLPLSLQATPGNVGIVTRSLFQEQYGRVLSDALTNVSNVNIQPGFGTNDFFVIRGFDSLSSSLVLTDGAPEPEATFYQLYNVELVEVLKGPGGFLYGSNPLAGTINLVRKQPFNAQRGSAGAALGSFSTYEGTLDYNAGRPGSDIAFRLNALYRSANSHRDAKESEAAAVNPAVAWQIDANHRLNANVEFASSDYSPDAGIPLETVFAADGSASTRLPTIDRGLSFNSPRDLSQQNIQRFQIDYEGHIDDNLTVRNKFYSRGLDWQSRGTLINAAIPEFGLIEIAPGNFVFGPTGTVSVVRSFITLDDDQSFVGNQLEGVFSFATGDIRHNLLAGVEIARFRDRFALDVFGLAPIDLNDPVEFPVPPFPIPGQAVAGNARSTVFAPYAIDQISVSPEVQLLVGLRWDNVDFKDSLTARERSDDQLSPMLGAVYMPHADLSFYGNYSRSFAPPSARAFGAPEAEESEQIEFGVKARWLDGRVQATAAIYDLERKNIAIPDDNGFSQQIGNQRSRGFELELAAEPGHGVRGVLSYAYNDAELTDFSERVTLFGPGGVIQATVDRSGNRPAFAPEHLFNVWLSKTLPAGLGVGLGGRYVSGQFIAEDNGFEIPSAFIVNASASYDLDSYRFSLNVQNLTDNDYLLRAFGSQSVTPAAPFAAFLRIGYAF